MEPNAGVDDGLVPAAGAPKPNDGVDDVGAAALGVLRLKVTCFGALDALDAEPLDPKEKPVLVLGAAAVVEVVDPNKLDPALAVPGLAPPPNSDGVDAVVAPNELPKPPGAVFVAGAAGVGAGVKIVGATAVRNRMESII